MLTDGGEDRYQVVAVDMNFDSLSKTRGDEFVLQNLSLFDKAKKVVFTGAGWSPSTRRAELQKEGVSVLEKSPGLIRALDLMTQEESRKRAHDVAQIVAEQAPRIEELIGQQVDVRIVNAGASPSKSALFDLLMAEFKRTLVNWLRSRSEPDEPILYYGKKIYSATRPESRRMQQLIEVHTLQV
jgi:hypothetical protein